MQDAGADALELNLYSVNADPSEAAGVIEDRYLSVIDAVRKAIDIPLAVKVSPHFSAFSNFASRAPAAPLRTASCCSAASTAPTSTWTR